MIIVLVELVASISRVQLMNSRRQQNQQRRGEAEPLLTESSWSPVGQRASAARAQVLSAMAAHARTIISHTVRSTEDTCTRIQNKYYIYLYIKIYSLIYTLQLQTRIPNAHRVAGRNNSAVRRLTVTTLVQRTVQYSTVRVHCKLTNYKVLDQNTRTASKPARNLKHKYECFMLETCHLSTMESASCNRSASRPRMTQVDVEVEGKIWELMPKPCPNMMIPVLV